LGDARRIPLADRRCDARRLGHNNVRPLFDTFFTPWHAVLYSGFLAVATVLAVTIARAHRGGLTWSQAVPRGYKISLVGVAVFAIGGIGDLL